MDAFSSSSKYHAETWICGYALFISRTHFFPPLFVFCGFSVHLFPPSVFFSSTNSEEAKSTTWLHPVTGEAVITGHRKTPGKQCGQPGREGSGASFYGPCENTRSACERLSARHGGESRGGEKKRGATSCGERGGTRGNGGRFLLSAAEQQPFSAPLPLSAPPSPQQTITHGV